MANVEAHVGFHENLFYRTFLKPPPSILNYVYVKLSITMETPLNYHFNLNKATPRTERLPFWAITPRSHTHICVLRKGGRGWGWRNTSDLIHTAKLLLYVEQTRVLSRLSNGQIILDDN